MVPPVDWNKYGYIVASEYRKKILISIGNGPMTPNQIAKETNLRLPHVSTIIHEIEDKGLVKCLTPTLNKGKLFDLTKVGQKIVSQLKQME